MPFFRLTVKRRLIDNKGNLAEPGIWAEISHINPHVPWANFQAMTNVINQLKLRYNIDLPLGKINSSNFDAEMIS